ncbi:MAG: hypothetical protein MZV64_12875 [Ignavibacteriales bacterium]|nr:hypothetical protein [Ignavibacteriales bacterium]
MRTISADARPGSARSLRRRVPGFPLQGPERPRRVQEDGQGEDGQPDGRRREG